MKFNINSSLSYVVNAPTTFIFNIHALKTNSQTVWQEQLTIDPSLKIEEFVSYDGSSRFVRLKVVEPTNFTISYTANVETRFELIDEKNASPRVPIVELDSYIATFLYPSRYCQSDKLMKFSFKEFGRHATVFDKVMAITEWVHDNIEYVSGSTSSETSAIDTIIERVGVCRDFSHLAIALCRALSIPARYFTGYAYDLVPQDFHACFEAYVDGNWIIFDPTNLAPLNGLVKIATGRDAADAAVASIFGNALGTAMSVNCNLAEDVFEPYRYANNLKGMSFQ